MIEQPVAIPPTDMRKTINRTTIITEEYCECISKMFSLDIRTVRRLFIGTKCWIMVRHKAGIKTPKTRATEKARRQRRAAEKKQTDSGMMDGWKCHYKPGVTQ